MPAFQVNRPRLHSARPPVIKTKAAARVLSGEDDVKLNRGLTWDGFPGSSAHTESLSPEGGDGRRVAQSFLQAQSFLHTALAPQSWGRWRARGGPQGSAF